MAQQLGILSQWAFGEWADRAAINRNATDLAMVEGDVAGMRNQINRQTQEILWLRAMFMGVVEVLHAKAPFDDAELEAAVRKAWAALTTPPPPPPAAAATHHGTQGSQQIVICAKCGAQVVAARTLIAATGTVCDTCA
jgi:hypothetical protein